MKPDSDDVLGRFHDLSRAAGDAYDHSVHNGWYADVITCGRVRTVEHFYTFGQQHEFAASRCARFHRYGGTDLATAFDNECPFRLDHAEADSEGTGRGEFHHGAGEVRRLGRGRLYRRRTDRALVAGTCKEIREPRSDGSSREQPSEENCGDGGRTQS